jgi:hypothetical protein
VLALVGIPLGLSSKKSGKSGGFVLTILLVFVYYVISLVGVSLARQGKVSPWFGAWLADLVFLASGFFCLSRAEKRPFELASSGYLEADPADRRLPPPAAAEKTPSSAPPPGAACSAPAFPRCSMTTCCATSSYTWADPLQLSGAGHRLHPVRIAGRHSAQPDSATVVAEYLLNVAPYLLYNVAPLVMLLACWSPLA